MLLKIKNWNDHYENAKSRTVGALAWVPIPNDHSNLKYIRLIQGHKNGAAHFGVFISLLQICSRQSKDSRSGYLTHDGTESGIPYGYHDITAVTRIDTKMIQEAIERLISPEIGWVIDEEYTAVAPQYTDGVPAVTVEGKGREQNGTEENIPATPGPYIQLSKDFLIYQREQHPKESAWENFDKLVVDGANNLRLFIERAPHYSLDEITRLLEWIKTDSFWGGEIRTLGGIRKRKDNGSYKLENAMSKMLKGNNGTSRAKSTGGYKYPSDKR